MPGTAIYMTAQVDNVPAALLHNMKHNKVLHERNVLMTVRTEDVPRVPEDERLEIRHLDRNFHTDARPLRLPRGARTFRARWRCAGCGGFRFNLMETSFFVGREKIVAAAGARWPCALPQAAVHLLSNMVLDATEFFRIPANRVVELGGQVEL